MIDELFAGKIKANFMKVWDVGVCGRAEGTDIPRGRRGNIEEYGAAAQYFAQ